jgi:hypothetical protein
MSTMSATKNRRFCREDVLKKDSGVLRYLTAATT